ncbi:MAG: DUF4394 domain-containing protein [Blastocatellia bacterium]
MLPPVPIYALDGDNNLYLRRSCDADFKLLFRVRLFSDGEILIGIDFRPADGSLYALSDLGRIYTIDLTPTGGGNVVLIGALSPRFAGGFQSLMDFNPVVNALRLIGSDDGNTAILNNKGNLNQTVVQTRIAYAAGDVNAGVDPNITGGGYTNNVNGARTTIMYALDYDLNTLTSPLLAANGSSATGGGQFQTIGRLKTFAGNPVDISPTADLDIYTDANGVNYLIGITGRILFTIDLAQINSALAPGRTQDVTVRMVTLGNGGFLDIAVGAPRGC